MARQRKDYVPMSVRLSTSVYEQLNQYCEEIGQPKTVAVERTLLSYINDYKEEQQMLKQMKQRQAK